uniref:CLIP domain-containing serine protease n=1 Tax=Glossina austeni TaxID=7395 RepID=A0A1A9UFJ9_GLOAU
MSDYASSCSTVNQEPGLCMPVKSCRNIYEIFQQTASTSGDLTDDHKNLITKSYCGTFRNVHHVCCLKSEIQLNSEGLEILTNTRCGINHASTVSRGLVAALFSFPWMALLKYNIGEPFKCGGSLITNLNEHMTYIEKGYVLTAAHCVYRQEDTIIGVRLGEYNISSSSDCTHSPIKSECAPPVEDVGIEEIIIPRDYRKHVFHDDIALIRLDRTVEFRRQLKPICLPITEELRSAHHSHYVISGWGRTENGNTSDVLMVALVRHIERQTCQKDFAVLPTLNEEHICAGGENLVDSCRGDSGGPLGFRDKHFGHLRFIQFGVVSFGINTCGQVNLPGVYTNVSHYMQWITDNIRK